MGMSIGRLWKTPHDQVTKKTYEDLNIKDTIIEYRKLWGCVKDENGIQIF